MRTPLIGVLVAVFGTLAVLVLERVMSRVPQWAWRWACWAVIAAAIAIVLLCDPVYPHVKNHPKIAIALTLLVLLASGYVFLIVGWPFKHLEDTPKLTFEVDTESGSEISIGYADEDESVGQLDITAKMKFRNADINPGLVITMSISIFRQSTANETPLSTGAYGLTFRTGTGESRYFSDLPVPASFATEDYWIRFVAFVRQDAVGELDRDCVLRLTMIAARQDPYSMDFPIAWWRAKDGKSYLMSPGMRF